MRTVSIKCYHFNRVIILVFGHMEVGKTRNVNLKFQDGWLLSLVNKLSLAFSLDDCSLP